MREEKDRTAHFDSLLSLVNPNLNVHSDCQAISAVSPVIGNGRQMVKVVVAHAQTAYSCMYVVCILCFSCDVTDLARATHKAVWCTAATYKYAYELKLSYSSLGTDGVYLQVCSLSLVATYYVERFS